MHFPLALFVSSLLLIYIYSFQNKSWTTDSLLPGSEKHSLWNYPETQKVYSNGSQKHMLWNNPETHEIYFVNHRRILYGITQKHFRYIIVFVDTVLSVRFCQNLPNTICSKSQTNLPWFMWRNPVCKVQIYRYITIPHVVSTFTVRCCFLIYTFHGTITRGGSRISVGGAPTLQRGAVTYNYAKYFQKLLILIQMKPYTVTITARTQIFPSSLIIDFVYFI